MNQDELKDISEGLRFQVDLVVKEELPRDYLGLSNIGHKCTRFLWFLFRWSDYLTLKAKTKRIFEMGYSVEKIIVDGLNNSGCEVKAQQEEIILSNGHIKGHIDGIIANIEDLPGRKALLEAKSMKDKYFQLFIDLGIETSHTNYWFQGNAYATYLDLDYVLFAVLNKDTTDIRFEIFETNYEIGRQSIKRAEDIINRNVPPPKYSNDPDDYTCRYCPMLQVCHHNRVFLKTCRTCIHSEPTENALWYCNNHHKTLNLDEQKEGCKDFYMLNV